MQTFTINGKEHELKLTLDSVKYLNGLYDGGAFEFIQHSITGNIDNYIDIIFAGLFHTEKGYSKKDITKAVEEGIANEEIDLDEINRTSYNIVANSFFYKATVSKMFQGDKEAQKQIEQLLN